jgi:transcriptional regulator with XRE-family HTH domain
MKKSINQRLANWLEYKEISQADLGKNMGKTRSQINQWCSSTPIPDKYILEIVEMFPDLNARWFITGEGAMTENETLNITEDPKQLYNTCPLCKEKDKLITAHTDRIADLLRDRDKTEEEIARLKNQCAEKDELLDWYKGKKETATDDSAQHRQAANE